MTYLTIVSGDGAILIIAGIMRVRPIVVAEVLVGALHGTIGTTHVLPGMYTLVNVSLNQLESVISVTGYKMRSIILSYNQVS